ncbi:MAG: hypothetical protein CMF59_00915 [Leptospiraceae bacterium]|nr:hypothetical protein [Leptospiraceae bacterium]
MLKPQGRNMESTQVRNAEVSEIRYGSQEIEKYYRQSQVDYRLLWSFHRSHSLHYGFWSESTRNLSEALERENGVLARMAGIHSQDVVLDAGCGVGGSAIYLAENLGCRVRGVSLCDHQLQRARRLVRTKQVEHLVDFEHGDYHVLTHPDESFSVIWCIESFCHSWNKSLFLREAFRLLKPGGILIIADGFEANKALDESESKLMRSWLDGWAVPDLLSPSEMQSRALHAGFGQMDFRDVTSSVQRSSRKLYNYATLFSPAARIASFLGLRRATLNGNLRAARDQYLALRANLWQYGVFRAWK